MSIHHSAHRQRRSRERSAAALVLLAAMTIIALSGVVLAFYFLPNPELLLRARAAPSASRLIEQRIEDTNFLIPETLIARLDKKLLGSVRRIDLRIPWPYGTGAQLADSPEAMADFILVTLEPRAKQQTHEELLVPIYSVYLAHQGVAEGFVLKQFKPGSPYADSELAVDYRETPAAVTRCDTRPSALGPILCERLQPVGANLMARIRFAKSHIVDWKGMDRTAKDVIAGIIR
jgi:hypothetical protein